MLTFEQYIKLREIVDPEQEKQSALQYLRARGSQGQAPPSNIAGRMTGQSQGQNINKQSWEKALQIARQSGASEESIAYARQHAEEMNRTLETATNFEDFKNKMMEFWQRQGATPEDMKGLLGPQMQMQLQALWMTHQNNLLAQRRLGQ
jgi:hypothetical protein